MSHELRNDSIRASYSFIDINNFHVFDLKVYHRVLMYLEGTIPRNFAYTPTLRGLWAYHRNLFKSRDPKKIREVGDQLIS